MRPVCGTSHLAGRKMLDRRCSSKPLPHPSGSSPGSLGRDSLCKGLRYRILTQFGDTQTSLLLLNSCYPQAGDSVSLQLVEPMTDYRLYCLNGESKIESVEWLQAKSDDEAVILVRAMKKTIN